MHGCFSIKLQAFPDHLKVYFIYFGVFSEDFELPVCKLLRLWVAEGFVRESGQECLDDIAEECLEDLVDRNLVLVVKKKATDESRLVEYMTCYVIYA